MLYMLYIMLYMLYMCYMLYIILIYNPYIDIDAYIYISLNINFLVSIMLPVCMLQS